jgi:hypothetical protein
MIPPDMERDPQLSALYRAGSDAGPPSALDDAIRAAARREVSAGPRRTAARRWRLPLSLAAVLVLSVSMVTLMREQGADSPQTLLLPPADVQLRSAEKAPAGPALPQGEAEARRRDKPAPVPHRPAAPVIQAPAGPPPSAVAPEQKMMVAPAASGSAPAGADAAPAAVEDAAGARLERQVPRPLLRSAPAPLADKPSVPAKPEPAALWRDLLTAPPEQWIERIVELRRGGKIDDADALAAEFSRRFPDRQLPAEAR